MKNSPMIEVSLYPALTVSKTPSQVKKTWRTTDRKSPIGSTSNQWG
ncbi:hypothetical protein ACMGD3_12475 [Lysinibacillus sphaericus]